MDRIMSRVFTLKPDVQHRKHIVFTGLIAFFVISFWTVQAHAGLFGLSPEQEQKLGDQEHPKVMQAYGGAIENEALAAYVRSVADKITPSVDRPGQKWTVTTLDSPIVNAFALPGGYIYITRGLLALANSEAELAGVLGHEYGHVIARHTAKRVERSNYIGIGQVLTAILTGEPQLANIAGTVGQLYLLNFSRNQEYEADSLGISYLTKSQFDPYAQAEFLDSLHAQSVFEQSINGQQQPIEFLSTHPNTANRVVQAIEEANLSQAAVQSYPRNRESYLAAIDGIIYGDSPAHGYVRGRTFSHPRIKMTFTAPQGFKMHNMPDKVVALGPNGASVQLVGGARSSGQAANSYIQSELSQQLQVGFQDLQSMTINNIPAATGYGTVQTQSGNARVRVVSYAFSEDTFFTFLMMYPPGQAAGQVNDMYEAMANSFRRLSNSEANKLKPRHIKVVKVKSGDTVAKLAARSAFDDNAEKRFRLLNDLGPNDVLKPGTRAKIIVE